MGPATLCACARAGRRHTGRDTGTGDWSREPTVLGVSKPNRSSTRLWMLEITGEAVTKEQSMPGPGGADAAAAAHTQKQAKERKKEGREGGRTNRAERTEMLERCNGCARGTRARYLKGSRGGCALRWATARAEGGLV